MSTRYTVRNDGDGPFVMLPRNGGEVGSDPHDICDELNRMLDRNAELLMKLHKMEIAGDLIAHKLCCACPHENAVSVLLNGWKDAKRERY